MRLFREFQSGPSAPMRRPWGSVRLIRALVERCWGHARSFVFCRKRIVENTRSRSNCRCFKGVARGRRSCPWWLADCGEINAASWLGPWPGLMREPGTCLLVSTDFTHYGRRFGYCPFSVDEAPSALPALDAESLARISRGDSEGLLAWRKETGTTICGYLPVVVALDVLCELYPTGVKGEVLHYGNSGEITGSWSNAVGYAAMRLGAMPEARELVAGVERSGASGLRPRHDFGST